MSTRGQKTFHSLGSCFFSQTILWLPRGSGINTRVQIDTYIYINFIHRRKILYSCIFYIICTSEEGSLPVRTPCWQKTVCDLSDNFLSPAPRYCGLSNSSGRTARSQIRLARLDWLKWTYTHTHTHWHTNIHTSTHIHTRRHTNIHTDTLSKHFHSFLQKINATRFRINFFS